MKYLMKFKMIIKQIDCQIFCAYVKSKSNIVINAIDVVTKYSLGHSGLFGEIVTNLSNNEKAMI